MLKKTTVFLILLMHFVHADPSASALENSQKKALIFGVSGQDGTYLAEFLLSKNYQVHGVSRNPRLAEELFTIKGFKITLLENPDFILLEGDIVNSTSVIKLIDKVRPDEIYNLAAQSSVKQSFETPEETSEVNAIGTLRILDALQLLSLTKKVKFFQAASSEIYGMYPGNAPYAKYRFHPKTPYGIAKLYSYWITVNYREAYGIFACNGILFNHESPLRGEGFVTRKITQAAVKYKLGSREILKLGNLDAQRDWGYAKDYVEAMWLMLQQDEPDDFLIATGELHSVREFVEQAFGELDIEIVWKETGIDEIGVDKATGQIIVQIDSDFYRPTETTPFVPNVTETDQKLNWKPKTDFRELVKIMIEADYKREKSLSHNQ